MSIDTHLFIEIILSEGAALMWCDPNVDGLCIEYYTGPGGKRVPIITNDEFISESVAKGLLIQLGLEHLIERLF